MCHGSSVLIFVSGDRMPVVTAYASVLSGTIAIAEASLVEAEKMAVNASVPLSL